MPIVNILTFFYHNLKQLFFYFFKLFGNLQTTLMYYTNCAIKVDFLQFFRSQVGFIITKLNIFSPQNNKQLQGVFE